MKKLIVLLVIAALAIALVPNTMAQDDEKPYEGVTIVVGTQAGQTIGGPIEEFGAAWEEETGAEIQIQRFAFGELFEKLITAYETGSGDFDMIAIPSGWAGDFMAAGYLEPVPDYAKEELNWDDILPLYRERILAWGDTVYAYPYDGDFHMLYYRKDLMNNEEYAAEFEEQYGYPLAEPVTWDQYMDMAEYFNGKVVETAGMEAPIYGTLEAQKRDAQAYFLFPTHAAGYAKIPGNPCFFFSCEDMTPQVNNPGWVRALEDWIKIQDYGPPEMINYDVADTRDIYPAGVSMFNIDWADVGPISQDEENSLIKGITGFAVLPGGSEYWDYEQGEWVTPEDGANVAPFLAFGGWVIAVSADSDVKEAAIDLAIFMTNQDMVATLATTPQTGINPSRFSQLESTELWVQAGFDEESAQDYLDAMLNTMNHPNAVLDLRITGTAAYQAALDAEIAQALAGEISAQEALDNVAEEWDNITDRLGREAQLQQYRDAVGYEGE
jgi:multiple sugar transport system substrate-binding protein